jgi:hypothetical protein
VSDAYLRTEAKSLGLSVKNLEGHEEDLVWRLYSDFSDEMSMEDEFSPVQEFIRPPDTQLLPRSEGRIPR